MDDVKSARIGFCSGQPKSGTSFLQRVISAHPDAVCPSEQHLNVLLKALPDMFNQYNNTVQYSAKHTAQAGSGVLFEQEDIASFFESMVRHLARKAQRGRPCQLSMIKDNTVINRLPLYLKIFPQSKFVLIVRDPRSIACSTWHNNLRIEPNFIERANSLEDWCDLIAGNWKKYVGGIEEAAGRVSAIHTCRYEDMLDDPQSTFRKIFEFLDLDAGADLVRAIAEETRFNNQGSDPYFRRGTSDSWKQDLSDTTADRIIQIAGPYAASYDYR